MKDGLIGLMGSLLIAGAAYYKKSLSPSGFGAAVVLGTLMYALGSLAWYGTLIAFFITSSALSKWKQRRKAEAERGYAKSGRRDAGQVLANGGLGMLLCLVHAVLPHAAWWAAYIGVMATVTADTWATEIGGLSRTKPRSVATGKQVEPGVSGGVTPLGLTASAAGGLFIGVTAWLLAAASAGDWSLSGLGVLSAIAVAGGVLGALKDSWLGAVCQVMYRCPSCGREIERNRHCNTEAVRIRGFVWMTNDTVNLLSSAAGGAVSFLLSLALAAA